MLKAAVRVEHVYKKFRRGEIFNSLRDLLPALTGRAFRPSDLSPSDKREFWALQDLSFEVMPGECLGIIGRNGAGKSTVLKILSRIMKPTMGQIYAEGRLSALIEVTAGFHQDLTGRENIFLNGTILGMSKQEIRSKLDQIIAFSGIEEFIDTPVKRYSSGMYARLGFSVAAHLDPEVLIVDEVLSVGDYAFQQKCIARMREVLLGGAAVLFVSHNLRTVAEFCDRCLLLEKGRTQAVGAPHEVISRYLLADSRQREKQGSDAPVRISSVKVRNEKGETLSFQSGEKAYVDVEAIAHVSCKKLSITFYILDDQLMEIFEVGTDLIGLGEFDLEEGDVYRCTFEVRMNLIGATYYPSVLIYRRDTQTIYDQWEPAATIYVSSEGGVRGIANCFPQVVHQEVRKASQVPLLKS